MKINVKNSPDLSLPVAATPKSAAYDVIAVSEPEIVGEKDGDNGWYRIDYIQYRTALYIAPQKDSYGKDYHVLIHPRSSVSKYNLVLANSIGLVDSDYRGEILVRYKYVWQPEDYRVVKKDDPSGEYYVVRGFVNTSKIYQKGDRVAQLVVEPTTDVEWTRVENLDETVRGTGGFGSTTIPITNRAVVETKPVSKGYESKVDLVEQLKKYGGSVERPPTYETLIKEREKTL